VADAGNHRALVYAAGQTTATRVYGQRGDMSRSAVNTLGASSESLNAPHGLAIDAAGGLFVADRGNARALYFPAGSTTATRVFGQRGDFSATADNDLDVSADRLEDPTALAVDAAGNLYVTDYENSRVLMYPAK